ncbi:hypothetical protein ScPMuIL_018252 [Solemya velum]
MSRTIGSVASYTCKNNYSPVGMKNIICNTNATWSATDLVCLIECGIPPNVDHASVHYTEVTMGSVASYMCDPGFVTNDPNSAVTCTEYGTWTNLNPYFECLAECGPPPSVYNAMTSSSSFSVGAVVSYTCYPEYVPVGPNEIYCLSDGQWSVPQLSCQLLSWPLGYYSLPQPTFGCPYDVPWDQGYIRQPLYPYTEYSPDLELEGIFYPEIFEWVFCAKPVYSLTPTDTDWPPGEYCIARYSGICPNGTDAALAFSVYKCITLKYQARCH